MTVEPATSAAPPDESREVWEPRRWWWWGLLAIAVAPFVTAAARAIADDWFPIGDSAQLYQRAAEVLTRHHPLLGSWSSASLSVGVHLNNPGAMHDYLVAPFARLLPAGPGNVIGVSVVNVAALLGAVAAARRIGGLNYATWVLAAGAAVSWMMGSELLFDMFQAHALLLPFLLALVLATGVMTGHGWAWPWLAAAVTFLVQTHVSYAYIVVVLGVVVVGAAILAAPGGGRWAAVTAGVRSHWAGWTALVLAVLWAQPLYEQLFGVGEGNMSRLLHSVGKGEAKVGVANAIRLSANVFAFPPAWTRSGFEHGIPNAGLVGEPGHRELVITSLRGTGVSLAALAILSLLLGLAALDARRHGDRARAALATITLAGLAGSVLALAALVVGEVGLAPHHTRWAFVLAVLADAVLVWTLVSVVSRRRRRAARWGLVVPALLVVGLSLANVPKFGQAQGPTADIDTMPALRRIFGALDVLRDEAPVLYRTDNRRIYEPYSSAIQLQMRMQGIDFHVDDEGQIRQLGEARRADGRERAVVAQWEDWTAFSHDFDGCVIAEGSAATAAEDDAMAALGDELWRRVLADDAFDVSGVLAADPTDPFDLLFAESVLAGDRDAAREITFDGRLLAWLDHGWVTLDPALAADLRRDGPALARWLELYVALTATPASACDG